MSNITVEQLAKMVGISSNQLLLRLKDAGITINDSNQKISDNQKQLLLDYIKSLHITQPEVAATLKLKKPIIGNSVAPTRNVINVTVRKRRMYHDFKKSAPENEAKVTDLETVRVMPSKNQSDKIRTKEITTTTVKSKKHVHTEIKQTLKKTTRATVVKKKYEVESFEKLETTIVKEITIPETLTVMELAQKMAIKATELIKSMMKMGIIAVINQAIDQDTAVLVAEEMGFKTKLSKKTELEDSLALIEDVNLCELLPRAPVVTIMGHVDHGKTSLLDYIRRTKVALREAGGITQHIGAYHVNTKKGIITFLDTPGHEAFTAMRARGAKCTDIIVLIIAADDGVKPQTIEAIHHAQAAKVPLIVAINKIDKLDSDLERIKTELTKYNVLSEEWGGDTIFQKISAKTGEGIDNLLESISVLAEIQELKAPVKCFARGIVIEAHLDKGYGPVASVLIQRGILHQGDILIAGLYYGKIRAMFDDAGKKIIDAGPSIPVEILGLSGVPNAGDEAVVVANEKMAREITLLRQNKYRDAKLAKQQTTKLEDILSGIHDKKIKILNIVLKTDVHGSSEAIINTLNKIDIDEVKIKVISNGVGRITESDVNLALVSEGIIIGFNVRADSVAKTLAEKEGIDIRYYSVIYKLIDDIKIALTEMLSPRHEEQIIGLAEVRNVFRSSKFGIIAGCMVAEGTIKRGNPIRVIRDNIVIYHGELESLRRFKDDVSEVRQGMECGIGIKSFNDIKAGDQIEIYKTITIKRTLES
ncbi:MAG: translation initiation factor IF-2 [Coxiellaceae bacterium]|jgi:translation initiation factor IF-2|nr:translation initiation factor IF-2 [Coxiellaceae bacterium]